MLLELSIENFALIDKLRLEFGPGLNVLTGETGAGKSIIIDAVEMVLGGRASGEVIRTGAERAVIEALFETVGPEDAAAVAAAAVGAPAEDEALILARELPASGRSVTRLNGRLATSAMVKEVAQHLVDLHGQHEHQSLLRSEGHVDLLDSFGGAELATVRTKVAEEWAGWRGFLRELAGFVGDEKDKARKLDVLQFQRQEIDGSRLVAGEEETLGEERRVLAGAEKLHQVAAKAYAVLYEGEARGAEAVVDQLAGLLAELDEAADIDRALRPLFETLESARYQIEEAARELGRYRDRVEFNPERLDAIENRLELVSQLRRKYGNTIEEILKYRDEVAAELDRVANADEIIERLRQNIAAAKKTLGDLCGVLGKARRRVARELERAVSVELADLGMERTVFRVHFTEAEDPEGVPVGDRLLAAGPDGSDSVEFLFSANPGEPPKPLAKIISGGEMARVMLALKAILARVDQVPTLIFDEIDAGVGGRAAIAVADKLARLGRFRQVLCVTHLPQIAAAADRHFAIQKKVHGGRTTTLVSLLQGDQRVDEVVRMLGGTSDSRATREHAAELIEAAAKRADAWPEKGKR
ncbi:MAG TPA: DNA repair protein RecN [Bacillota bacterium]